MGLTPHQYYSMTRAEFYLASKGYHRKQLEIWQHTRFLGYQIRLNRQTKQKAPSITNWFPLSTDKQVDTQDRIKGMLDKLKNKTNG